MKILHVISSLAPDRGGAAEIIPYLCIAAKREGAEARMLTFSSSSYGGAVKIAEREGVSLITAPSLRGPIGRIFLSREFKRKLLEQIAWADIVQVHGLWEAPDWHAEWYAKRLRKKLVVMPHGSLESARMKKGFLKKVVVSSLLDRRLINTSDLVLATADSEIEGIRKHGINARIDVIPLGLHIAPYASAMPNLSLLESMGIPFGNKVLLYFSRITPIKGLDLLAKAWSKIGNDFRKWTLLIVGPDDRGYTEEIKRVFTSLCREGSFIFHGPVYKEEKISLLASVDALVLPTRSENFSIAVAEAMASGKPVVCTKGAPWSCLNEANAGRWVDIESDAIEKGIRSIFNLTQNERAEMGARARKWVSENLDWSVIGRRMKDAYNSL